MKTHTQFFYGTDGDESSDAGIEPAVYNKMGELREDYVGGPTHYRQPLHFMWLEKHVDSFLWAVIRGDSAFRLSEEMLS